jgi:glycosyltransferase involved in cell wall biosynthesis
MKILQLIDQYKTGGAEKVYDLFSKFCILNGYIIDRYVIYGKPAVNEKYLLNNTHSSLIFKSLDQIVCIKKIRYFIKKNQITNIVSFLDRSNMVVIFACLFLRKKPNISVTIHNPPTIQYMKINKYIRTVLFVLLYWAYNRKWVKVIAVSRVVKYSLIKIGVKNVNIIYNPFEFNKTIKKSSEIKFHNRYLISIGRLEYQKAHWKLLKSFSYFKEKYADKYLYLYIAGTGKLDEYLKKLCIELNIDDSVLFLGYVNNINEYIKNSLCMISSSLYEGFPISLLECISEKKPFIGSEESVPEEIKDILVEKKIINTYKSDKIDVDFNYLNIYNDEKELASLIYNIANDNYYSSNIANICYNWLNENCSLNNFFGYLL